MTYETYTRIKTTLNYSAAILGFISFIIFVAVMLPHNLERRADEARHHQELIDAIEQMTFICTPETLKDFR